MRSQGWVAGAIIVCTCGCGSGDPSVPEPSPAAPSGDGWSIRDRAPYPRAGQTAIVDERNDRMIVFGGGSSDTWTVPLSGPHANTWSELVSAGEHPPVIFTADTSAVYDPAGQRMLALVNNTGTGSEVPELRLWQLSLGETPTWTAIATTGAPRLLGEMVLDAAEERVFLSGRDSNGSTDRWSLWSLSLDGEPRWTHLADPPPTGGYGGRGLMYDAARQRLIVLVSGGGTSAVEEVWAWSLGTSSWTLLGYDAFGGVPTLDPDGDRIVMAGLIRNAFSGATRDEVIVRSLGEGGFPPTPSLALSTPGVVSTATTAVLDTKLRRILYFGEEAADHPGEPNNAVFALSLDTLSRSRLLPPTEAGSSYGPFLVRDSMLWDPRRAAVVHLEPGPAAREHGLEPADVWAPVEGPTPTPPLAIDLPPVYDSKRGAVLAVAGDKLLRLSSQKGSRWESFATNAPPGERHDETVIYDAAGDRMIVYGGTNPVGEPLDDVWALNLAGPLAWTELAPSGASPVAPAVHVAAYDSAAHRMLVYGGGSSLGKWTSELWGLSLGSAPAWTRLSPAGAGPDLTMGDATATYEANKERLIIAGHQDDGTPYVVAVELGSRPAWREFRSLGTPPAGGFGVFTSDGLFWTMARQSFRFDLNTPYCPGTLPESCRGGFSPAASPGR